MAGQASRENGKKGGRPKGSKSATTIEREAVLQAFRDRVARHADILFNAQFTIARGQTFLYKIEKEWVQTGKGGFYKKKKPKIVTNPDEIARYLEGNAKEGDADDDQDPDATYYFLTTKEPNNFAIEAMLDRTFGKSKQRVEHTGEDGGPIQIQGVDIAVRK